MDLVFINLSKIEFYLISVFVVLMKYFVVGLFFRCVYFIVLFIKKIFICCF